MPRFLRTRLAAWLLVISWGLVSRADEFVFFHEQVLGTSFELRVRADDVGTARRAEGAALQEIDRLSRLLSGYDPTSEFVRWQAEVGIPVRISDELFEVLTASDLWRRRSGGAFDPRVAAFSAVWSVSAARDRTPTPDALEAARRLLLAPAWALDPVTHQATRISTGPLSLDGIAKGFIVERACDAAMAAAENIEGILLNIGGDLRAAGSEPWIVGLAAPRGGSEQVDPPITLNVRNVSVATSGDAFRGWTIQGRRYSHILDPRTGCPVESTVAATVVTARGVDADALATIANVLSVEETLALTDALPETACLLSLADGRRIASARWEDHVHQVVLAAAAQPADPKGPTGARAQEPSTFWGDTHEVAIEFEINRPEGESRPYRRPYVAVWVEDEEGHTVRTLSLWISMGGAGPEPWIPDLRRWHRGDDRLSLGMKKKIGYTIARATRPPGRYTVIWDGKDDAGQPLGRGPFTLFIEAAREHGTYQLLRSRLVPGDEPSVATIPGGVEIKAASVTYRRKDSMPSSR